MLLAARIEVAAGAGAVRRAAIALLVQVEAVRARRQALDVGIDLQLPILLRELHPAVGRVALRRLQFRFGAGDRSVYHRAGSSQSNTDRHPAANRREAHHGLQVS